MKYFRVVTLVMGFFAVQLSLVGGALAYPVGSHGSSIARQANHVATMAGMQMADDAVQSRLTPKARGDSPTEHPCDQSGLPQSCQAPLSCTAPFAAASADRHASGALPPSDAPMLNVLAPLAPTLSPELPPPKR